MHDPVGDAAEEQVGDVRTAVADDDPEVATFALYSYLSWLLEQMVEAINPR